ncbi:hypothetical protein [Nocardia sp. CS682]|nr:hypothetical protein [Nocardia sp. CS682]
MSVVEAPGLHRYSQTNGESMELLEVFANLFATVLSLGSGSAS